MLCVLCQCFCIMSKKFFTFTVINVVLLIYYLYVNNFRKFNPHPTAYFKCSEKDLYKAFPYHCRYQVITKFISSYVAIAFFKFKLMAGVLRKEVSFMV